MIDKSLAIRPPINYYASRRPLTSTLLYYSLPSDVLQISNGVLDFNHINCFPFIPIKMPLALVTLVPMVQIRPTRIYDHTRRPPNCKSGDV